MRASLALVLLVGASLAGCATPVPFPMTAEAVVPSLEGAEVRGPFPTTFHVLTRAGGLVRLAGYAWFPLQQETETVLVAVHGSNGGARFLWDVPVPGYSFARVQASLGRAVVAIDLPGYGNSTGSDALLGIEDYATVLHQVAKALRGEPLPGADYDVQGWGSPAFDHVVGVGISMGGLLVDVAQGLYGSFDAIVPASWSHGGYGSAYKACRRDGDCPEDWRAWAWAVDNLDPRVEAAFVEASERGELDTMPLPVGLSMAVWSTCHSCVLPTDVVQPVTPRPDEVTQLVRVPVLIILGTEDFWFDGERHAEEPSHFGASEDVQLLVLEATGHDVFHHRNHDEVHEAIDAFLDRHGLRGTVQRRRRGRAARPPAPRVVRGWWNRRTACPEHVAGANRQLRCAGGVQGPGGAAQHHTWTRPEEGTRRPHLGKETRREVARIREKQERGATLTRREAGVLGGTARVRGEE